MAFHDIRLIAAIGKNGAMGLNNNLPWSDPDDLKWFRKNTVDDKYAIVVLGRRTYESILVNSHPNRPLPGRTLLVMSSAGHLHRTEDTVAALPPLPVQDIIHMFAKRTLWIAGGLSVYNLWMPYITRFYLSRIDYTGHADTFFPFTQMLSVFNEADTHANI